MGSSGRQRVLAFYSDKENKPFREFSNFYRHRQPFRFDLPKFARRPELPEAVWCEFSEKAIMVTKAALMNDSESFKAIDAATDPKSCKALGRGVRNWDEELWKKHLEEVAFEVVRQKFDSSKELRQLLLSTGDSVIAEAAPNDAIWGIGLPTSDPRAKDPAQWCGRNVLGYALMRAREHLRSGGVGSASNDAASTAGEAQPQASQSSGGGELPRGKRWGKAKESRTAFLKALSTIFWIVRCFALMHFSCQVATFGHALRSARRDGGAAGEAMPTAEPAASIDGAAPGAASSSSAAAAGVAAADEAIAAVARSEAAGSSAASKELGVGSKESVGEACCFDCFAVLDFEATCEEGPVPFEPQEVIEFPIVLVDPKQRTAVAEFRTYVRPVHRPQLTAFCTRLTGIEQASVDAAPAWPEALRAAEVWLEAQLAERGFQRCAFVTCGDWDLKTMVVKQCATSGQQVPSCFREWLNIKNLFRTVTGQRGGGMASMLEHLQLKLEGRHHSGLDDSRNIARILLELLRRGLRPDESQLSHRAGADAAPGAAAGAARGGGSGKGYPPSR